MSSYWDIYEKKDYAISHSGQITMNHQSGRQIYRILHNDDSIKRVVEIGTWNGLGSTICIIHGIQGKDVESFQSIECNREKHLTALDNLESQIEENTVLLWGSIVDTEHIKSQGYRDNFPSLSTSEKLRGWFDIDIKNCEAAPNVLDTMPDNIDFLLLDGGEYTTLNEFEKLLPRCTGYIALDDIYVDKCNECRRRLINNPDWKEIVKLDERNGFSIFIHISRETY